MLALFRSRFSRISGLLKRTRRRIKSVNIIPLQSKSDVVQNSHRPIGSHNSEVHNVPVIFSVEDEIEFDRTRKINVKRGSLQQLNESTNLSDEPAKPEHSNKWASPIAAIPMRPVQITKHGNEISIFRNRGNGSTSTKDIACWKPSTHLHKYFKMMRLFCTASVQTRIHFSENEFSWRKYLVKKIHKIIVGVVVGCAVFDEACQAKLYFLDFLDGKGFNAVVASIFHAVSAAIAIYGTLCLRRKNDIKDMISAIDAYEKEDHYDAWITNLSPAIAIVTATIALAGPTFQHGIQDEPVTDTVLISSWELSTELFIWHSKNMTTKRDHLYDQFAVYTWSNMFLGCVKITRDFFSNLMFGMIWEFWLIVVLVMLLLKRGLMKNVKQLAINVERPKDQNTGEILQGPREMQWRKYRRIRPVFHYLNVVFGPLLPLFHARNVVMYALLVRMCILPDERANASPVIGLIYAYNLAKAEIMYVISSRIAGQDEWIRKWLRNWGINTGTITVQGREWDLSAVLDELDHEPLAFGQGSFEINQRFHFGLLGVVSSLFVSLANGIGKYTTKS